MIEVNTVSLIVSGWKWQIVAFNSLFIPLLLTRIGNFYSKVIQKRFAPNEPRRVIDIYNIWNCIPAKEFWIFPMWKSSGIFWSCLNYLGLFSVFICHAFRIIWFHVDLKTMRYNLPQQDITRLAVTPDIFCRFKGWFENFFLKDFLLIICGEFYLYIIGYLFRHFG